MEPINRGVGITDSERYLAKLADRTFLDLWSYPNTFNDRRTHGKGVGQELCDLLVVCGDDVIIFSDKSCRWIDGSDVNLSWSRWYRRAVSKSIDQIRGAERWLMRYPNRVFIDSMCTQRLPIELPSPARMKVHGVAIALGAQEACSRFFKDPDGSLMVRSHLKGADHTNAGARGYTPFAFGDVDPAGAFVHVFDETALNLVMSEMNTIRDFTDYLIGREKAIRTTNIAACSEADMIAAYLQVETADGKHYFPSAVSQGGAERDLLAIEQGEYQRYIGLKQRNAKISADRLSFKWDELIRLFSGNLLAGTSVTVDGVSSEIGLAERALRVMALERRVSRRGLATAFLGALKEADRRGQDRFARVMEASEGLDDRECGYVFLILAYRGIAAERGYEAYRVLRSRYLQAYCEVALFRNRKLTRVVGIAVDASSKYSDQEGGSQDLLLMEIPSWTPEEEKRVARMQKDFGILNPARLRPVNVHVQEYPEAEKSAGKMPMGNRASRRAARSRERK